MWLFWLICGIQNLVIWGFDFKYDYDVWTWLWFGSGILYCLMGIVSKLKSSNKQYTAPSATTPKSE